MSVTINRMKNINIIFKKKSLETRKSATMVVALAMVPAIKGTVIAIEYKGLCKS